MDPLADKLLVVAALVALVSLDRLAAWVAMVIIAREFAVTGLRSLAAERGVVIAASWMGKVKTALQVAAIIALIVCDPTPVAVDLLVYVAVAVTVISGADYFFGLRSATWRRTPRTSGRPRPPRARDAALAGAGLLEPLALGHVAGRVLAGVELGEDLGELAGALGDDRVAVDRLQVLLAGEQEAAVAELRDRPRRRGGPSRARRPRRSGVAGGPSRRRRPRRSASSARRSRSSSTARRCAAGRGRRCRGRSPRAGRGGACRCRAGCGWRRGRGRRSRSISSSVKPSARGARGRGR